MDLAGIQNAMVGMALFDMWDAAVHKSEGAHKAKGSPLVAAATAAFEQYIQQTELGIAAQISGVAVYALNPGGNSVHALTQQDIAPFLAMNVMG
jgi:hypothetical protein